MKRRKASEKVGPAITYRHKNGNGRVNEIKISATFRPEPDYGKLSRL